MANGYTTEFTSIQDLLSSQGYDMSALQDPGSLYGFGKGTPYGKFFRPFDVSGYNQAQSSLRELEQNLLTNVSQKFSAATTGLQSQLGTASSKIFGEAGRTGFGASGASERRREQSYETGMERFGETARQTRASYTGVQEQIGTKLGQLEGSLFDYLGGVAQTGLQITSMDPTGGSSGKMTTQQDIDSLLSNLSAEQRSAFSSIATPLIGQPYQVTLDAFKDFMGNQQGGGMYG
jgi:hypothetical protein